jgi:ATPase subunit of ABC transporter with duplicated ATPase domains
MMKEFLSINDVSFSYADAVEPLFEDISIQCSPGWTGIVGPNGGGKSTLLKLINGELQPDRGSIKLPGTVLYAEQRMEHQPPTFQDFVFNFDKTAIRLKNQLQIQVEWLNRWDTLSFGERKRCQIAVVLAEQPSVLLLDEPSNHLDHFSKTVLMDALRQFSCIGLLVSHDRELLDDVCRHTIFIDPPNVEMRACSFSLAAHEREREQLAILHERETIKKEVKKLKRRTQHQRQKAETADKQRSKRSIHRKDHDAKAKIDAARLTGKDAVQGRLYKRAQDQLDRAVEKQSVLKTKKQYALGIQYSGSGSDHKFPLTITARTLDMGRAELIIPELAVMAGEKIGLIGDNGAGKSTFITHLVKSLPLTSNELIYIPQEISHQMTKDIFSSVQNMSDADKGELLTIIRRLGSEPARLLETTTPSPGEVRKLMLAEGLQKSPALIIMDEPTNHMDLPSIQCVEQALVECGCALLLVSHDFIFLKNIVSSFWTFERETHQSRIHPQFSPL